MRAKWTRAWLGGLVLALLGGAAAQPIADAAETCCTYTPNSHLPYGMGRLLVTFPEGAATQTTPIHLYVKDVGGTLHKSASGSLDITLSPGTYALTINKVQVTGVRVDAGYDTRVRVGVLRLDVPAGSTTSVGRYGKGSVASFLGAGDVGLPVGDFEVVWKPASAASGPAQTKRVTIEDGAIVTVSFRVENANDVCCTTTPNPALYGDGRVLVTFPAGYGTQYTPIQLYADYPGTPVKSGTGSLDATVAPGTYVVTINRIQVANVRVQAGYETRVRVGVLRLNVAAGVAVRIGRVGKGFSATFTSPGDVGLPVGDYDVEWTPPGAYAAVQTRKVTIGDGKFVTLLP